VYVDVVRLHLQTIEMCREPAFTAVQGAACPVEQIMRAKTMTDALTIARYVIGNN
jgi:hypothetical protein